MAVNGVGRPTKDQAAEQKLMRSWLSTIAAYERTFSQWRKREKEILFKYRDERGTERGLTNTSRFNILWSNVQTLRPATFSRLPQPDVSRRFKDNDPVGRVASLIMERGLDYEVQHYPDYRATMNQSVDDRFLGGRGTAWARYEPHMRAAKQGLPVDGVEISEDIDEPGEELDYECAPTDYVNPDDFGHSVARTWEEVTRVWRKVYLDREACVERFGKELGEQIPLDSSPMEEQKNVNQGTDNNTEFCRALVYEGWDKTKKKAYWFAKGMKSEFLDIKDDPLGLEGFFPCPRPLYATMTNDSLIPVPDYCMYQDQAMALDTLATKIDGLIKALQVKGLYDSAIPELKRLFTEATNTDLIPVKNWANFAEKSGLKGAIELVDLIPIAQALKDAYEAMEQQKQQVYEITGIADIIRGSSKPSETLGAQKMKANYAGLRIKNTQEDVAQFATGCLRLKAQIMCSMFSAETLMRIAAVEQLTQEDQAYVPDAMRLLIGARFDNPEMDRDPDANPLRSFRVDIAADTLVQMDEEAEKQSRVEFLDATGKFMKEAVAILQAEPGAAPIIIGMLKFGVTGFTVGKQLEGVIDDALDKMMAAAKQPKQQKPDPEMAKVQAQQQADQARIEADKQGDIARAQADIAIARMKQDYEARSEREQAQFQFRMDQAQAREEAAFARFEAILKARTAVEVAEIGAQATLDSSQIAAANQGTQQ